jgi:hypothetical protein
MFYTCVFTVIALIYSINLYKSHYPKEFDIIVTQIISFIQQNETIKPYLPLLTTMCYNAIYAYSFCQVTLNKTIKFIEPYLQEGIKNIHLRILYNKNTDTTNLFTIVNANIYTNSDSNLVIIKSPTPKNDMIILDKVPDNLENITYEPSRSHILSLYLKMVTNDNETNDNETNDNETNYNIQLSSDTMNFYVVGNIFNTNFFKYYLENVLNVKIDNDTNKPFTYTLELMDHNVSMAYLNETQSIVIKKYGYEILESSLIKEKIKSQEIKSQEIKNQEIKNDNPGLDASTICY